MAEKVYMDLLDYATGLYAKALQLLEPGRCDDFSVISGSLILMVGLEKLTKSFIYQINPLMILLDKPDFEDLYKHTTLSLMYIKKIFSQLLNKEIFSCITSVI